LCQADAGCDLDLRDIIGFKKNPFKSAGDIAQKAQAPLLF
jgi:hypothetical protein